jgi:hypothetical protein
MRVPLYQRRLTDAPYAGANIVNNIEAAGDEMLPKEEETLRIAFQNIH